MPIILLPKRNMQTSNPYNSNILKVSQLFTIIIAISVGLLCEEKSVSCFLVSHLY